MKSSLPTGRYDVTVTKGMIILFEILIGAGYPDALGQVMASVKQL